MAKLPKLWVHVEDGETWLSEYPDDSPNRSRLATEADLTAELVADYLDRKAEGSNHHDFVGLHLYLARVVLMAVNGDSEVSRAVMLALLRKGGLHRVGE